MADKTPDTPDSRTAAKPGTGVKPPTAHTAATETDADRAAREARENEADSAQAQADNAAAGGGTQRASESGHAEVQTLLAKRDQATKSGDDETLGTVNERLKELGYE